MPAQTVRPPTESLPTLQEHDLYNSEVNVYLQTHARPWVMETKDES